MAKLRCGLSGGVVFILVSLFFTVSLNASVTYEFNVTEEPPDNFHKPLAATLTLSDSAVTSGQATNGDIESLVVTGGTAVREDNPVTLSHVHPAFINWTITLSEDRNRVTAISAIITPHNTPTDHLVFHQEDPPHPTLQVLENLGYVSSDYIRLETTLLPVPPQYHTSRFTGYWERAPVGGFILLIDDLLEMLACFPFCPLPWAIIIMVIILPLLAGLIIRNRTINRR